jgi:serine protease Do
MIRAAIIGIVAIMAGFAGAAEEPNELSTRGKLDLAAKYSESMVRVEYTLRYDQADAPTVYGWVKLCPVCGQMHPVASGYELLREERPVEMPGFLIAEDVVATPDISVESRFVESIKVRHGESVSVATPKAWAKTGRMFLLGIEKPLAGTKPLTFDKAKKVVYILSFGNPSGMWTTSIQSFSGTPVRVDSGVEFRATGNGLVVADDGTPVGLSLDSEVTADDGWQGSPIDRPLLSAERVTKMGQDTKGLADKTLLLAHMTFRSPKADKRHRRGMDDEGGVTELFAPAVVVEPNMVMVLADLKPEATARLERVGIEIGDKTMTAKFKATIKHYGAFVADLESPIKGAAPLSQTDITTFRNSLMPTVNLKVQGSQRTANFCIRRFSAFEQGWKGHLRPDIDDSPETFFFDAAGNLVAVPLAMRQDADDSSPRGTNAPQPIAAADIADMLKDLPANTDVANVPLSEEEENRLAWLGVEMQPLDKDLARANNVSHLTEEGQTGALVSYVYPESPAATAGIEAGAVLLRLHVPGRPLPIAINLTRDDYFAGNFPWDRLDEVPEQYFDEIPKPWPGADNSLNRALTDLGFGTKVTIDYVQAGKELSKELVVTPSPMYYDSAPRFQSVPLGITVRDLTYEVRRYFQRSAEDPGVIVTKIEPGSRASVAGIKPYEIITQVNDQPVATAADFGKLTKDQKELRLAVKRMLRGRVVKISLNTPAEPSEPNGPLIMRRPGGQD